MSNKALNRTVYGRADAATNVRLGQTFDQKMRSYINIAIMLIVLAGCSRNPTRPSSLVVAPGTGIPGVVELGMTVDEVRVKVRGEKVKYYPDVRYPWQVADYDYEDPHLFQARSSHTRKPGEKPTDVKVEIPTLGLVFYTKSDADPIRSITFWSDPDPIPVDSNTWFTGSLSCGLSFADRRRVPRHEVVKHFGEPAHHLVDPPQKTSEDQRRMYFAVDALLKRGETVSKKHSNGVEHLHYPTNGIMFILQNDKVLTFTLKKKVEQTAAQVQSEGAPSD